MRNRFSLVSVSVLALALAACGGPPAEPYESTDEPAAAEDASAAPADAVDAEVANEVAAETGAEAGEDAAEDAAAPAPTPTPTASPTPKPKPSPTKAAAMAPPAAFATCGICHSVTPGQNGVGPSLAGVFGRKAGSAAGYSYSAGMQGVNVTWNEGNLKRYLADPNAVVPGGSMPAPGVDSAQATAIVNYLKTL